jgi:predicted transcriptional regulator
MRTGNAFAHGTMKGNRRMKVEGLMTRHVHNCSPNDSLTCAAHRMRDADDGWQLTIAA